MRRTTKGIIFGTAFALSAYATSWGDGAHASTQVRPASSCTTFSKYGGMVPCDGGVPVPSSVRTATIEIVLGCGVGLSTGPGAGYACAGVVAGQLGRFLPQ